jgi:hypothetical protein
MTSFSDAQLEAWGASLREIDPSTLQEDPESGPVRWFQGEAGCEAFVWLNDAGEPHHVQLIFANRSVEWSQAEGLRTGSLRSGGATAGGRYDGYLLQSGHQVDLELCAAARRLLAASCTGGTLFAPLVQALWSALGTASTS